uniref:Gelsolin-like domain-containing protein n=1 Tax=Monopterus albus TaxID=43700 RepID=A0A3Q3IQ72_MONAL
MVSHKEFEVAGKQPGLQVWRIENMDLKPVPKSLYGSFYTGDAYLLLFTTPAPSYNIHMWLGRTWMHTPGFFSNMLEHLKGGVASGFHHVVTNEMNVKRLLHIKGRRAIRATEVDMSWTSFNKGDCFIIDLGQNIYQWCGSECNHFEKLKVADVAIDIRDKERNGRAKLHLVDEGREPMAVIEVTCIYTHSPFFFPLLVKLSHKTEVFTTEVNFYEQKLKISDASGTMKMTVVAPSSPFKQAMLSPEECYILDNGVDKNIFVWKGPKANTSERKAAMSAGQQFIKDKGYSNKTLIQVIPAGAEPTLFKQFFSDWKNKDETTGPSKPFTIGHIAKVKQVPFDASTLHSNTAMAAQHGMVDDGKGKVKIWRVENGEKVPVDPSTYGHFYGGDCYLILYSYRQGGREQHIIYTWQGLKCTQDELAASAFLTVKLDDSMGGSPVQVRVTQGQEPSHLMSLFHGKPMIIHLGGTSRKGGHSKATLPMLPGLWRLVDATASKLNTNDVFVLKTPNAVFVWRGMGASDEEMDAAKYVVGVLGGNPTTVPEGKETAEFWSALGGKKEYQTSKSLQRMVKLPRLFGCSDKTGRLIAEEVPGDFTQSDLAMDDVMILDTGDQIFLWVGNDANDKEKAGAPKIAKDYVNSDPSGRRGLPITTIKQGAEPPTFTGWFHAWDPKMWDKDPLDRIRARF